MDLIAYLFAKKYTDKKITDILAGGADGVITQIKIGDKVISGKDGTITLPQATADELGLVKGSGDVAVAEDGSMIINEIGLEKVVQEEGHELYLDCNY